MIKPTSTHILVDVDQESTETPSGFVVVRGVGKKPSMREFVGSPVCTGIITAIGDAVETLGVGNRIVFKQVDAWMFEKEKTALMKENVVLAVLSTKKMV